MLAFYLVAALMIIVALAFIVVPLVRASRGSAQRAAPIAQRDSNVAILRQQRQEILRDFEAGNISASERDDALVELTEQAGEELGQAQTPSKAGENNKRPWLVAAVFVVAIPVLVGALYWGLGSPEAVQLAAHGTDQSPAFSDQQILDMVDSLAEKMKKKPDDLDGWLLLARSQSALKRFPEAAAAYEHANQLSPKNAALLADYADVLAMTQNGSIEGKPFALVQEALKIDPENRKALAIAGTAEMKRRNFPAALGYWEHLLKLMPAGTDDYRQVADAIEETKLAMGEPGAKKASEKSADRAAAGPAKPAAKVAASATGASTNSSVSGKVGISAELAKQVTASDTVFILARAANWRSGGPRAPLAVLRARGGELPRDFELTDAMAMAPGMKLSDFPEIVVEARVSKSGGALAQPGDLQGLSYIIKPGARGVNVLIDQVVK
jgi:cytochrome c-type biogenesis protein CcmH